MCCLARDKHPLIPATPFANTFAGFTKLFEQLDRLGVPPEQVLIGLEATSRYGENLFQALLKRGYQVCLLHPAQMHAFAQQRGIRSTLLMRPPALRSRRKIPLAYSRCQ